MKTLTITTKNFTSQLNVYKNKRETMQALLEYALVESNNGMNLQRFQQIIDATKDVKGISSEQIKKYILAHGLRVNAKGNLAPMKGVEFERPAAVWYEFGKESKPKQEKSKEEWLAGYSKTILANLDKHGATVEELETILALAKKHLKVA